MHRENDSEVSLIDHLDELRFRLIWALGSIFICVCIAAFFSKDLLTLLKKPIADFKLESGHEQILKLVIGEDNIIRASNMPPIQDLGHFTSKVIEFSLAAHPEQRLTIGNHAQLYYSGPMDPFMMQFKVALIG